MQPPHPLVVLDLFADDRTALLSLLAALNADDWEQATTCDGWSVKDVASHILGSDLANLSRRRDGYQGDAPAPGQDLVSFLNGSNDIWMHAARRLSPRVVYDLLAAAGPPLFDYFASLDLLALGAPVSWAGPAPAPVWLDVAREYTERWHHQQHIRDAVGQPGQTDPRFLHSVLATFAYALPATIRMPQLGPSLTSTSTVRRVETGRSNGNRMAGSSTPEYPQRRRRGWTSIRTELGACTRKASALRRHRGQLRSVRTTTSAEGCSTPSP